MKKMICGIALAISCSCSLYTFVLSVQDNDCPFSRAVVKLPDGTVKELEIEKMQHYRSNIHITATDGKNYLVSPNNAVLIRD